MKRVSSTILTWLGLTATIVSVFAGTALAATQPAASPAAAPGSGQALEIAPPVLNITADPGQTVTSQISLRDISSGKLVVKGQVNDFMAAGEDGTPKILLEENDQNPYSLKAWVSPLQQLTLEPRQIKNLPIVIKVPANASPGSYYGVVRFTATAPELQDTGVSLSASLGALVFLRVNGAAKEGVEVVSFTMNNGGKPATLFESTPVKFVERLKNTGNVHEQPAGQITISDMFGNKIANVNINLPPRSILPQSIRKFEQPLDSEVIGDKVLFGRYTAKLLVTYGSNKQTVASSITFWIVPWRLIGTIILGLIVAFFLLRYGLKRYNDSIIERSRYSRRRR